MPDRAKAGLKGKYKVISAYIRKEEILKMNQESISRKYLKNNSKNNKSILKNKEGSDNKDKI